MKEQWKQQLSEQEQHMLRSLDRELRYHGMQSKGLRKQADFFKISTLSLAALSTVVLGLEFGSAEWWTGLSNNIALVLGAAITVLSGIATFWNIDKYRMSNITMYLRIKDLRNRFVFEAKKQGGLSSADLIRLNDDFKALKAEKVRYWERAMEELGD